MGTRGIPEGLRFALDELMRPLSTLDLSLEVRALGAEAEFGEQLTRCDHFDTAVASTIGEPLVVSDEGALLELRRRGKQSVASVIDVSRPESVESLVIGSETSEIDAREVHDARTGRDKASQIDEQQEKSRPALFVGDDHEFVNSDVREQHFKLALVDRRARDFIGTCQVRDGVNRVGIHKHAAHEFAA